MGKYASNTSTGIEKSQADIKSTLRRYGAGKIMTLDDEDHASIAFEFKGLTIQLTVSVPNKDDFRLTDCGRVRKENAVHLAWEQAIRQRWRALLLAIKAKLECVESGISTVEQEFMAFVVLANNMTAGEYFIGRMREAAQLGNLPQLELPAP